MRVIDSFDFVRSRGPNLQIDQPVWPPSYPLIYSIFILKNSCKESILLNFPQNPASKSGLGGLKSFVEQEPKNHKQCDFASNYSKHILQFRIVESMHYFRLQEISTPTITYIHQLSCQN